MLLTALMPVKRHSERVPGKNMKLFAGIPLYHIMLQTLQSCDCIDKIIINTDSPEVMRDVSDFSKAMIIERPPHLLGNMITMNTLIDHDIEQTSEEHFFQTHCTNPLLKRETIEKAAAMYFSLAGRYDSLYSVNRIQSRVYRSDHSPLNHDRNIMLRTQDLDPVFEENSNFFIFSRTSFRDAGNNRIGRNPLRYEMSRIEAIDIDYPEDFLLAELIYLNRSHFNL